MPCNEGIDMSELKNAFELLDVDGNGTLDIEEFVRYKRRRRKPLHAPRDIVAEPDQNRFLEGRDQVCFDGAVMETEETRPSACAPSDMSPEPSSHSRTGIAMWSGLRAAAKASALFRRAISKV